MKRIPDESEKCPDCGSQDLIFVGVRAIEQVDLGDRLFCKKCRTFFPAKIFKLAASNLFEKMFEACENDWERGLISILHFSGSRLSSISKGSHLLLIEENGKFIFQWVRRTNGEISRNLIPSENVEAVRTFLSDLKSQQYLCNSIRTIGARIGYLNVTASHFRQDFAHEFKINVTIGERR
jgi:hypothetical protein